MFVKPGLRLRSAVCDTEIIVVRTSDAELDLRCGGRPMVPIAEPVQRDAAMVPGLDLGSLLGKRYGGSDLELLCTKAGQGSLSIGAEPLPIMEPRKLPSSD